MGFHLHAARSVADAVDLLHRYGDDTQLLAGGTALMVLARLGLLGAEHLVDLCDIPELSGVRPTSAGGLRIGALSRLRSVETDPAVRAAAPALRDALHSVATVRIRNQATIGGNLAHADPAQDPPPMLMVLGAHVEIAHAGGTRSLPVDDLFAGYWETNLDAGEVLTSVVVPPPAADARAAYLKFLPGSQDDYATVSVAAAMAHREGRCDRIRVALGGAGPTPLRAPSVEAALSGELLDAAAIDHAARQVSADIDPISDRRGSAEYKTKVAVACVRRVLTQVSVPENGR